MAEKSNGLKKRVNADGQIRPDDSMHMDLVSSDDDEVEPVLSPYLLVGSFSIVVPMRKPAVPFLAHSIFC